ncbi:P-loop containing nucleoside triphosphate hydrolase protein [Irpex rosettiformis]|uniref:P-loop containing nucleoside triphosphate hydrolase protein n=1 Tax=Irpex rosettiformis TaxID=378272 RepID=A0ACB8TYT9_9APHY|nr:P-loop containing nucleoside triphosphate hydrolase protein [Irpex rosettiformis]
MASSAALTTTHLPRLRKELEQWRAKQSPALSCSSPLQDIYARLDAKDSIEEQGKDKRKKFQASASASVEDDPEKLDQRQKIKFCPGISLASGEPGVFVAHVPGMKWSGPTLTHKKFDSDLAFGHDIGNDEVYHRTVIALDMIPLALAGGTSCILAYGQTGSGKTYTMEALEYRVARDLFVAAEAIGTQLLTAEHGVDIFEFNVTFLELLGKRASDLLEPIDGLAMDEQGVFIRKEIAVHEDKVAMQVTSWSPTLTSLSTHRTGIHALLNIKIKNKLLPFAEDGQLILVDGGRSLAGSERYEDSKRHDKQRMLESRENNNGLMHLKECVRAKAKMAQEDGFVHIPWRANKLSMLLKVREEEATCRTGPFPTEFHRAAGTSSRCREALSRGHDCQTFRRYVHDAVRTKFGNIGGNITAEVVRTTSAEIMGTLSFLILRAKTKARTNIMKTRKHVALDIYGEVSSYARDSPLETVPGTDLPMPKQGTEAYNLYTRYKADQ